MKRICKPETPHPWVSRARVCSVLSVWLRSFFSATNNEDMPRTSQPLLEHLRCSNTWDSSCKCRRASSINKLLKCSPLVDGTDKASDLQRLLLDGSVCNLFTAGRHGHLVLVLRWPRESPSILSPVLVLLIADYLGPDMCNSLYLVS
jgi:hypothetical protein